MTIEIEENSSTDSTDHVRKVQFTKDFSCVVDDIYRVNLVNTFAVFYLKGRNPQKCKMNFLNLEQILLQQYGFVKANSREIINPSMVAKIERKRVELKNGWVLPIALSAKKILEEKLENEEYRDCM